MGDPCNTGDWPVTIDKRIILKHLGYDPAKYEMKKVTDEGGAVNFWIYKREEAPAVKDDTGRLGEMLETFGKMKDGETDEV